MNRFDVKSLVPPEVETLHPYQAQHGEYAVRLDANESPFPLPAAIAGEVREALAEVAVNRYPDPASRALRAAFAAVIGVPAARVTAGNGSDELITLLFAAFRRAPAGRSQAAVDRPVALVPVPSFAMYFISGQAAGFRVDGFPLTLSLPRGEKGGADLSLDRRGFMREIERVRPNLVFLAQPNNPTGTLHARETVEAILDSARGLVVVDEAYGDFAAQPSWAARLSEFPNLAVLRTLSKVGGAALRCGFLVAREEVLREVEKVRGPFNVNAYTQAAGARILGHPEWLKEQGRELAVSRDRLLAGMTALGLRVFPSQANFLLATAWGRERELCSFLAQGGIAVRSFTKLPVVGDALRVTVGTAAENNAFLARVERFFREEDR
jgi:histidinol-phosphate aminotransferase